LSDSECQSAAGDLKNLSQYDTPFLLKLAEYLRLLAQDSAAKGDYQTAINASLKRPIVIDEYRSRKEPPAESQLITDQERLIRERRSVWKQQVIDFDDETTRQVSDIRQQYIDELSKFNEEWETVRMERYRKPSATLIKQRMMEAEMIRRDQIERALFLHDGVKALEQQELVQANADFERHYKDAKAALIAAQQVHFQTFSKCRMTDREFLLRKIEKQEAILNHRLSVLQQKPPDLSPWRAQYEWKPVAMRPKIAPSQLLQNPGEKLPRLTMPWSKDRPNATPQNERTNDRSPAKETGQMRQSGPLNDTIKQTVQNRPQQVAPARDVIKQTVQPVSRENVPNQMGGATHHNA
jgi:hypothetical protein